jgi:hypothetical protein
MPSLFAQVFLAGAVLLVALLAMLNLFRGFRRYLRQAKYQPVEPVVEVNPPEPVVKTAGLELVAWVAILWSVANLAILVVAALTLQERPMLSSVPVQLAVMVYALVATVLAGWGGVMLLKRMAYGRRAVAWGAALFGILNVFGFAVCLFLRQHEDVSLDVQRLAVPVAVVLAVHTLINTAIGVAAQHVGLAGGQEGEQGPPSGGAR